MAFTRRNDGVRVSDLPAFKRLFPYVMRTRSESIVFFNQKIDMTNALAYLDSVNRGKAREERTTIFHLFLAATARTLLLRPELNRFVVGRRIYRHNEISITFIVKKELTEEAPETESRVVFGGREDLPEVRAMVNGRVRAARSGDKAAEDDLVNFVASLPRPLINLVAWLIRSLDYHNILPSMLKSAIPLYTSVYLTNVGSIGLEAPYHHLFEIGSASLFMGIGRLHKEAFVIEGEEAGDSPAAIVARDCINVTFTLDERVTEGFYCAKSILVFQKLMENPRILEARELSVDEILA